MTKNPFQYGKIAEKENFIDREQDRQFLKQSLYSGTNVILVSPRRWGKTSVVKQSMQELCQEHDNVRVCHIDAFPITSSAEFYRVFAQAVLRATASHFENIVENIGRFLKTVAPKISFSPEAMSEFSLSFEIGESKHEETEILNLPEQIAKEKGLQIVVCIDEFQKLAKLHDYQKIEAMMRSVWQHHQHTSYCLYGSQRHMMEDIFNSPEKPFYRFGQMYPLKKISLNYWVEYIQNRFASTGKTVSADIASRIAQTVECHSWYVQQLASAVWNFSSETADDEAFSKALTWCIDINSETYRNICDRLTDAQIGLLRAIAEKVKQLSASTTISKYRLGSSAAVNKNKTTLTKLDVITTIGSEISFLDPVFLFWFKQNY